MSKVTCVSSGALPSTRPVIGTNVREMRIYGAPSAGAFWVFNGSRPSCEQLCRASLTCEEFEDVRPAQL